MINPAKDPEQTIGFMHRQSFFKSGRGFTLVEILVVLSIIAILTIIGLTEINNARKNARDARRFSDLQQIRLGLALYATGKEDIYPRVIDSSGIDTTVQPAANSIFSETGPLAPYLGAIPRDPTNASGLYYSYDTSFDFKHYVLCAKLEAGTKYAIVWYENAYGGEQITCPGI